MKKKMFVTVLLLFSGVVSAGKIQRFHGDFTVPVGIKQEDKRFDVYINYEITKGDLVGTIRFLQAGPCGGERVIRGKKKGKSVNFKADVHQVKGCGRNKFKGRYENGDLAGEIYFEKEFRKILFKKEE